MSVLITKISCCLNPSNATAAEVLALMNLVQIIIIFMFAITKITLFEIGSPH
jgi:hypothetical protein